MPSYRRRTYPQTKQQKRDLFPYFFFFSLVVVYRACLTTNDQESNPPPTPLSHNRKTKRNGTEQRGERSKNWTDGKRADDELMRWGGGGGERQQELFLEISCFFPFSLEETVTKWRDKRGRQNIEDIMNHYQNSNQMGMTSSNTFHFLYLFHCSGRGHFFSLKKRVYRCLWRIGNRENGVDLNKIRIAMRKKNYTRK